MNLNLFLGSLELQLQLPAPVQLDAFDARFSAPVLPVTKQARITYTAPGPVSAPDDAIPGSDGMLVSRAGDRETRAYLSEPGQPPYCLSRRTGSSVTVTLTEAAWQREHGHFRPWFNLHLEQLLLANRALVLHSASIIYRGRAILFTAPSGTGKTTQTLLWKQYVADVGDLNGDRTLLQRTETGWYACGFPLYGSSLACEQTAVPFGAIVVVRRAEADSITELSSMRRLSLLYSECTVPAYDACYAEEAMTLLQDLIGTVPVVQLNCTMTEGAVEALKHYLEEMNAFGAV